MSSALPPATDRPSFRDSALPLSKRIDDLVEQVTLDERLAMLHQYAPGVPRLGVAPFRTGSEALHGVSWLGAATVFPQAVGLGASWDVDLVRQVADAVSTELRAFHSHRPPAISTAERGPTRCRPGRPCSTCCATRAGGATRRATPRTRCTQPGSARRSAAACPGTTHPTYLRAAPVLKHFLAYNNEDDRCTTSSGLRPRVLQEYDLAAFRPVVASGAATGALAAYNLVNGRPCHVSPLIEAELRRWAEPTGHALFVVSDAEAPSNLVDPEHYFDDHPESHAAALKAGIDSFTDLNEDSSITVGRLREGLERGLIDEADVDRAVRRQLELRFRLGEFDPDLDPYAGIGPEVIDCSDHRALARQAATESVVLLKNDGLLPLDPARTPRIAVIGPLADTLYEDWYSGTMPYQVSIAAGLDTALGAHGGEVIRVEGADRIVLRSRTTGEPLGKTAFDVTDWGSGALTLRCADDGRYLSLKDDAHWRPTRNCSRAGRSTRPSAWNRPTTAPYCCAPCSPDGTPPWTPPAAGSPSPPTPRKPPSAGSANSCATARPRRRPPPRRPTWRSSSSATTRWSAAGKPDRAGTELPEKQEELLRKVTAVHPETALVLMSSYPYAVDWAHEHLPAVVWTSHGGQETGHALAAVLLGAAEPAGRLPQTWYRGDDPLPDPLDYDIIKAGWTYQYHRTAPLYPFGHRLCYTDFAYRDLRLSQPSIGQDGSVDVTLTLDNSGQRPGSEVVQVYVRALGPSYEAPRLSLADFRKVRLGPGESRELTFRLSAEQLAHWSVATGAFAVDPGGYEVIVARSADNPVLTAPLTVAGRPPRPGRASDAGSRPSTSTTTRTPPSSTRPAPTATPSRPPIPRGPGRSSSGTSTSPEPYASRPRSPARSPEPAGRCSKCGRASGCRPRSRCPSPVTATPGRPSPPRSRHRSTASTTCA